MSSPGDFGALFEAVPDALVLVDGTGRMTRANSHAERLFGYAPGALAGLQIEILIPENARARHRTHRANYMASPRVRPMGVSDQALVGQRRDGHQFPVEIALSPIAGGDGPRYLASIRDVSESQRVRQAYLRAGYDTLVARIGQLALESPDGETLLEILPEMLAQALEVSAIAIAGWLDGDNMEITSSHGLGDEWDELVSVRTGRLTERLWKSLAGGEAVVLADLADSAAGREGSCAAFPLLDRHHPMGALIALSRHAHHFGHDALHLLGSAATLLSALIQRRRAEEQLIHAQRLDAVGQMTGGVAHDFNNLLTIISGNLQILEASTDDTELSELIDSASRATSRGAELTGKLLTFARRQRLVPQSIDACARLDEIARLLRRTLGEKIALSIECPSGLPPAKADPTQLDTALINLVLNARDSMPHGGDITMQAAERWVQDGDGTLKPGHYIVFSVVDTGQGMTPEVQRRAVEPFFTTKGSGRGSGLGLSMVYGFAEQSGGSLRIESRLGYGTRVDLGLPVGDRSNIRLDATLVESAAERTGEVLLVVEDDDEVRRIATSFISSLGYRAVPVRTSAEARERLHAEPDIALLFTDVRLGSGMDGIELARWARSLRPKIGVLLTSGYVDQEPEEFDLLTKPYRKDDLSVAILRNLRRPALQSMLR